MPVIQPITAVPTFVSQDEYASIIASTPNSFSDIPAVIKHKEDHVTVAVDPPLPGLLGDDLKGTLYVLTTVLVFFSVSGHGFQVEYPSIILHAVSRGESGPSVYCQLEEPSEEQHGAGEGEYSEMRELSIIASSPDSLETIFEALSHCASLHPDNNTEEEDGLNDDAFIDPSTENFEIFTGGEDEELSEVGRAALEHLESIIYNPFEDAQEAYVIEDKSPTSPVPVTSMDVPPAHQGCGGEVKKVIL